MAVEDKVPAVVEWLLDGEGKDSEMSARLQSRIEDGLKIPKTDKKALKFLKELANDGDHDAQCMLGLAYEHGLGIGLSFEDALKWYRVAADDGDGFAKGCAGELCFLL